MILLFSNEGLVEVSNVFDRDTYSSIKLLWSHPIILVNNFSNYVVCKIRSLILSCNASCQI